MALSRHGRTIIGIMGLCVVGDVLHDYVECLRYSLPIFALYNGLGSEVSVNEREGEFSWVITPSRPSYG